MAERDNRKFFESFTRVLDAVNDASPDDRLEAVTLAWLTLADQAANRALAIPGGYPEERQKQFRMLDQIRKLVEDSQPDLEMERAFLQEEYDALLRRVKEHRNDLNGLGEVDNP